MVERGIKGEGPSATSVTTVGKNHPYDLQVWGGTVGGGVGYYGFPPKRERGVSEDRNRQGGLESLGDGG